MSHLHDVALYAPNAHSFYGSDSLRAKGGAERQTVLLAQGLSERGLRVAHVVYPVDGLRTLPTPAPTIVERSEKQTRKRFLGGPAEVAATWRALKRADASVYIFRGSGPHLTIGAAFCKAFRRKLVFSSSNDLDYDFGRVDRTRPALAFYRLGVRASDRIVAQTGQQLDLARRAFPASGNAEVIPSFAEPGEPLPGEAQAFLWTDRLVDYKCPHRYLELAASLPEAQFWMVGARTTETSAGLLDELRVAADRLPNLELLGPRPRKELLALMRSSAAVVTTSLAEGMPNTFLEAWGLGVPVLSLHFDPDGLVSSDGLGIAASGRWEDFLDGAKRLWTDPSFRGEAGARGRQYVENTHSPPVVAGRWAKLVSSLLRNGADASISDP